MKKFIDTFLCCFFLCLILSGCGGPSEEKIAAAQDAYSQLVQLHNEVVEAHKGISDSSLDDQLVALSEKAAEIETMNLSEMNDETIDSLIETINSFITSYEEQLQAISQIKEQEDSAVIILVSFSLTNETDQIFQKLFLYKKNDTSAKINVLEEASGFHPEQTLVGLTIYKDVSDTPWILELENADGAVYEIELPVKDFSENGEDLVLAFDTESQALIVQ